MSIRANTNCCLKCPKRFSDIKERFESRIVEQYCVVVIGSGFDNPALIGYFPYTNKFSKFVNALLSNNDMRAQKIANQVINKITDEFVPRPYFRVPEEGCPYILEHTVTNG